MKNYRTKQSYNATIEAILNGLNDIGIDSLEFNSKKNLAKVAKKKMVSVELCGLCASLRSLREIILYR